MRLLLAAVLTLALAGSAQATGRDSRDRLAWKKATADCLHYAGCSKLTLVWKIDTNRNCTAYAFKYNTRNWGQKTSGYILC